MTSTFPPQAKLLITGGAGFIGSSFVRLALQEGYSVLCLDALTYAGHRANLREVESHPQFRFIHGNICDFELLDQIFQVEKPTAIVHFAAESHVDNSITGPQVFAETNLLGTLQLLEVARKNVLEQKRVPIEEFRFVHISTDEVFGQLGAEGRFSETTPYAPNSPYSATKAGSDFLARAWNHTYGLPTIVTNCSNNYGPRQFPEKLIPRMIACALAGEPLPVYGKGENIRDWIHVEDHCRGVFLALTRGRVGGTYLFGGQSERRNIDLVRTLCRLLDEKKPRPGGQSYEKQITFVEDRLGHDFRYAIDDSLAVRELGFERHYANFEDGLSQTIDWYLSNTDWLKEIQSRSNEKDISQRLAQGNP